MTQQSTEIQFKPLVPPVVLGLLSDVVCSCAQAGVDPATALRADDLRRYLDMTAPSEAVAAQAARLLLADLFQHGWTSRIVNSEIWLRPSSSAPSERETAEDLKRRQREALQGDRHRQLGEASVRKFLTRMETPRLFNGRKLSVLDVVDDGGCLAQSLAEVTQLPPSERAEALARVIHPVVEVATATTPCPYTGLVTLDVWRYFRHTWSIEYRSTPGRMLAFLIRNAARPMAPVMGIACLANATLQLRVRDNGIGWTVPEIVDRLREDPSQAPALLDAFLRTLRHAKSELRTTDLMTQVGRARGEALEVMLEQIACGALERRKDLLEAQLIKKNRGELVEVKNLQRFRNGEVNWREASENPLFVAKRARALAGLLHAERVLARYTAREPDLVDALLGHGSPESAQLQRALSVAAREVRKVGLASRILELSVCGAVPPYRDLLVGKLVALAVASAEVADEYAARYRGQHSEIASQMAGRAVSRDTSACVITTTSIYGVVASQYNKLKLGVGGHILHWQELKMSAGGIMRLNEGWTARTECEGTGHIGEDTVQALSELTTARARRRHVNSVFGEAQCPRLRQVREGLTELGLEPDVYLPHRMPRRVYGLELFAGARRTLCLNGPASGDRVSIADIAQAWRDRWLQPRIANRDVLARVATCGPKSVRAELAVPGLQSTL